MIAAEVGHLELAHEYLAETALMDLRDLNHNTRDGVHIGSLAGSWLALVAGFGGMRSYHGRLSFAPRLPGRIDRLTFSVRWRGLRLRVTVRAKQATYELRPGPDEKHEVRLTLHHHGQEVTVTCRAVDPAGSVAPRSPPLTQPAGAADPPRDAGLTAASGGAARRLPAAAHRPRASRAACGPGRPAPGR